MSNALLTEDLLARQRRTYGIDLQVSLSPWAFRPWCATMTHGTACVGEAAAGVCRARSREKLIAKCERWARRNARSNGMPPEEIIVEVREPLA